MDGMSDQAQGGSAQSQLTVARRGSPTRVVSSGWEDPEALVSGAGE